MRSISLLAAALVLAGATSASAADRLLPAQAQAPMMPPPIQAQPTPAAPQSLVLGMTSDQVAAVGIGVVGGLVVLDGILGMPPALAAVLGGLAGNWYYQARQADLTAGAPLNFRIPSEFSRHAAGSPVLEARWLVEPAH